ncbi:NAC domain-containing protein 18 [Platanthera zijinensis]|uniref:NAC domain-containing protein 18 n=1 Tax=Platanthera zijinensis TaxID=2320716 RepID=A0AAP0FUW9_9ASPA
MERKEFMKQGLVRLPPGFRFQPTDEELVVQYLRRKALSFPLPAGIIPEIELEKLDNPWDLPSGFGGEKYFFYLRDGKRNRVYSHERSSGYWKATGKEKQVTAASWGNNELVGSKKVMVFHSGKPPRGSKTDWIMHEYSLLNSNHAQAMVDSGKEWVVCRIFAKRRIVRVRAGRHEEKLEVPPPTTSSSSPSCVTEDLSNDGSVGGDEAMSKSMGP